MRLPVTIFSAEVVNTTSKRKHKIPMVKLHSKMPVFAGKFRNLSNI
jgi:hypothetical protein